MEASNLPKIRDALPSTLMIWGSETGRIARISPAEPNSISTDIPGPGGSSDLHAPGIENRNCCPSTISRPGPILGSRKTLPRFFTFPLELYR